jgi:hypothetical protein
MENYKGYILKRDPQYCYWKVAHDGKGGIPAVLQGLWINKNVLIAKIDHYRAEVPLEAPEAPVEAPKARAKTA